MVSSVVLTAAPAEVGPWPVLASALVNALRAALLLALADAVVPDVAVFELGTTEAARIVRVPELTAGASVTAGEVCRTCGGTTVPIVVAGVTVPAGALVVAVPGAVAPDVAT